MFFILLFHLEFLLHILMFFQIEMLFSCFGTTGFVVAGLAYNHVNQKNDKQT